MSWTPQSCAPYLIELKHFIAPQRFARKSLVTALAGISIGVGGAVIVAVGLCVLRRHQRREAGRKGLYTCGAAPGLEEAEAEAED